MRTSGVKVGHFSCEVRQTRNTQICSTAALSRYRKKNRKKEREREGEGERKYVYIYIYEVSAFFDICLCKNQANIHKGTPMKYWAKVYICQTVEESD